MFAQHCVDNNNNDMHNTDNILPQKVRTFYEENTNVL